MATQRARIAKDLDPPGKRGRLYVEWTREAMLQNGQAKQRAEFLSKHGTTTGIMSRDEGRRRHWNMARVLVLRRLDRPQNSLAPFGQTLKDPHR